MRLLHGSDFHGLEAAFRGFSRLLAGGDFDAGILSGDLTTYVEDRAAEESRLKRILLEAGKPVFFVMGNDDGILGNDWPSEGLLVNINLRKLRFKSRCFIGYCYTNPYVGGPFEKSEEAQAVDLPFIAAKLEPGSVLVTHGPGFGLRDRTRDGLHVGGRHLRSLIDDERVLIHLCGHIHQDAGREGKSVNMAYPEARRFAAVDLATGAVDFLGA